MSEQLEKLIEASRATRMSSNQIEVQRRSFAYGNAHIENPRVTREMVAEASAKVGRK